jgi:hypothetical protein
VIPCPVLTRGFAGPPDHGYRFAVLRLWFDLTPLQAAEKGRDSRQVAKDPGERVKNLRQNRLLASLRRGGFSLCQPATDSGNQATVTLPIAIDSDASVSLSAAMESDSGASLTLLPQPSPRCADA